MGCGKNERHANKAPIEKRPNVRLDGIYASQDSDGKWQYLRFTEQEVWIETSEKSASEVAAWIGGEKNRKPIRGKFSLDGQLVTVTSDFLSLTGELRENGIHVPPRIHPDPNSSRKARDYTFESQATMPVITDKARHLADCYEKYQEFTGYASQPPNPTRSDVFFNAMEALADWIEMTPTDRQKITQAPAVHKTPIGRLRLNSQLYLTPAGGLPPPHLFENHGKWKPIVTRIIETQFKNRRPAAFFVEWLVQATPPPLLVRVARDLIAITPPDEFGATQLGSGLRAVPLRVIPGGRAVISELANSDSPAFKKLAKRLGN